MSFGLRLVFCTVYLFISCSAYCGTIDWSSNDLETTLQRAKKLIRERDPKLSVELKRDEEEFRTLLWLVVRYYTAVVEQKNRVAENSSYLPPVNPRLLKEMLLKLQFSNSSSEDDCRICAFPRPLYMGLAPRSALNFVKYGIILFDQNQWELETLQNKKLLALVELVRFVGIENEDSRYKAAAEILNLAANYPSPGKLEESSPKYNLNPANFQEFEVFDQGKVFMSFSTTDEASGVPRTEVFIANSKHPIFYGNACQKEVPPEMVSDSAAARFYRGFSGVGLIDPLTVDFCQGLFPQRTNMEIRGTFSTKTRLMEMCIPRLR